ncbi:hypothetical protein M758_8G167600 [Ceratodon purpureus]|nr:hypothetical protein M758_8G167600 [Ceratodon purpureus]
MHLILNLILNLSSNMLDLVRSQPPLTLSPERDLRFKWRSRDSRGVFNSKTDYSAA